MNRNIICKIITSLLPVLWATGLSAQQAQDAKLTGTVIGTEATVDYATSQESTTVNTRDMAFDGDLSTYFATWDRSYTWCGLDLGTPHVITRVGWSPRDDYYGQQRVQLGIFEGSNREDFMDALPLYIIDEQGTIGQISYADVTCSRGFRYVRYVGPNDARCNIAEVEFYGHEGDGDDSHLYQLTNLPTVSIHTLNGEIPYDKEHDITAHFVIISNDGTKLLSASGTTRERGNASRTFPKKPYQVAFEKKQNVLNAPAKAKKWNLINNYGDKTLMRNLLANHLSRIAAMPYTPFAEPVDVLLNGEYKGCYQLSDKLQVADGRVEIDKMTTDDIAGEALTGGYLVEIDAYATQETSWFWSAQGNPVTIQSPSDDEITTEQHNYIESSFNSMEANPAELLDYNTFLRHFLVGEFSGNTDTYWSTYMYKHRGNDIFYTGPVWDFDIAFENDTRTYPINNKTDYVYRSGGSCAGNMRSFVDRIVINDANAQQMLLAIWGEMRHNGATPNQLTAWIDSVATVLNVSQRLNFIRWPIMNQIVHQNPRTWGSYEAEVENVKRFISERVSWMDNRIGYTEESTEEQGHEIEEILNMFNTRRPYCVYDLYGRPCNTDINTLPTGVYIIRQGGKTWKIKH